MKLKIMTLMIVMLILAVAVLVAVPASAGPTSYFCSSSATLVISQSVRNGERSYARCYDNGVQLWRLACMKGTIVETPVSGGVELSCSK